MDEKSKEIALLPIDLRFADGKSYVVLAKVPRVNLTDPFFLDSLAGSFHVADVNKAAGDEQNVLVRPLHYDVTDPRIELVPIDAFVRNFQNKGIDEKNTNFVFHMSRCGSTLAMQMLATINRFYVISEPTVVLAILNPLMTPPDGVTRKQLLQAAINAIHACKPDHCERVFIKFRSWNILLIEEFLGLYPNVRWMFTHRNGLEVLESVLRDPPGWMRSRHTLVSFFASIFGLSEQATELFTDGEYATRLLGTFCKNARMQDSPNALFVDYVRITDDLPAIFNYAWNLALTDREIKQMHERTKVYSKDPEKVKIFEPDSEKKRQSISAEDRIHAETFVEGERRKLREPLIKS